MKEFFDAFRVPGCVPGGGADHGLWHDSIMTTENAASKPKPEPFEKLHKDGSPWARGFMLEGEMHGDWEWFRVDGTRMRSGTMDRGRQVGIWTTYDKSGVPYKETDMGR